MTVLIYLYKIDILKLETDKIKFENYIRNRL